MKIELLWEKLSNIFDVEEHEKSDTPNYIIRIPSGGIKVRVGNYGSDDEENTYANVVCVSRHFVKKPIYTIKAEYGSKKYFVKTTSDHTCMRIREDYDENGDFIFEQISAKDLKVGDYVSACDVETWFGVDQCDTRVAVTDIEIDENVDGCWVYDLEVDSNKHVYYANGILVHNSQFINLASVTKCKCRDANIDENTRFSKLPDDVRDKVVKEAYHILDLANDNVERLINEVCHTKHGNVLHYSLEYIAAEGMYFKKKHYIVRKVISDDLPCSKFKYSGISVKKAEIPASMKDFLRKIYEDTMTKDWDEGDYKNEVKNAFNKFITLDWGDISYYKNYRTLKRTISLTESEKGAGIHARAANFYNMLLEKLNIAGRYPKIGVGDQFRYSYILPTNEYGMDCIAFKDTFPEEFRELFKPDYETMFNKIFTKSLENYVKIMGYRTANPMVQEEDPSFSIF